MYLYEELLKFIGAEEKSVLIELEQKLNDKSIITRNLRLDYWDLYHWHEELEKENKNLKSAIFEKKGELENERN